MLKSAQSAAHRFLGRQFSRVHQVQGTNTLLEMISMAEEFGRRWLQHSNHATTGVGLHSVAGSGLWMLRGDSRSRKSISRKLWRRRRPGKTFRYSRRCHFDPKAELIYVTGDVKKSGGYILGERQTMSVLQAVSLAEGLGPAPDPRHAKILR